MGGEKADISCRESENLPILLGSLFTRDDKRSALLMGTSYPFALFCAFAVNFNGKERQVRKENGTLSPFAVDTYGTPLFVCARIVFLVQGRSAHLPLF